MKLVCWRRGVGFASLGALMRALSVIHRLVIVGGLAGLAFGPVAMAMAQSGGQPKRTIIESLDDVDGAGTRGSSQVPTTVTQNYDFSVMRETLPPVSREGDAAPTADWVTVVEARDLQTGSIPTDPTDPNPVHLWLAGLLIAVGSLILFRRRLQTGLAQAFSGLQRPPLPGVATLSWLTARVNTLGSGLSNRFSRDKASAPQWDAETEHASYQMTTLLNRIETVVSRLKDGAPLRDVLNQELRLIHYRIEAASEAARQGHDTSEKSAARFRGLVRELERVQRIADSAAASVIDPRDQLSHPQSPSEAYAMLGVNPDAAPQVLKKLVDALRVTWHPDHARNESDRLLREERIKQINSAWDLINSEGRF